jgi:hypothetical protein
MIRAMPFRFSREGDVLVIVADGIIRSEDVPALRETEQRFFADNPKVALFLCDCLDMKIISPEAREELAHLMRQDNPLIERSAYVIGEGAAALQLRRMFREAGTDKRRLFNSRDAALAWLHQK